MLDPRLLRAVCCLAAVGAVVAPAWGRGRSESPDRFLAGGLDRHLVRLEGVGDGRVWAAWSYRDGAEFAVAVSALEPSGQWSEPVLFGALSGSDEIQPALATDGKGTLFVAYAVRETGAVQLHMLRAGATRWSDASVWSAEGERAFAPVLQVIGDHLVLAYRVGGRVVLRTELLVRLVPHGVQDGPDGFPPTDEHNGGIQSVPSD